VRGSIVRLFLPRRAAAGRALLLLAIVSACARPRATAAPGAPPRDAAASGSERATSQAAPPLDPARLHVVLVNGGGTRAGNYQSHVVHVRSMLEVLTAAGVPRERITVFASDGQDPAADLATRELRPEGEGWLLEGTPLEATLAHPMEYVSTAIPGQTLRAATPEAIHAWFADEGKQLQPGDTLLLYVTDHGTPNRDDPTNTRITLWGERKSLSVRELGESLAQLAPGVKVVMLMSQCFSGGFAHLARREGASSELPAGDVCGYFASTALRPAYGCYPENLGDDNVGHSVRFIEALAANGSFTDAQAHTLVTDRTPDVPLRTSDVQLELLLERAAKATGQPLAAYADELLREAWREPGRFEPDIRLLDRMGQSFGFASPRSLAEVDERLQLLPKIADPLSEHADSWSESLEDATRANLERFLAAHPAWRARAAPEQTRDLDPDRARDLGSELLEDLEPFTAADGETSERLAILRERAETADDISYRMEVREAALLRMRALLLRIAGEVYLETRATPDQRAAFAALERCEDVALDVSSAAAPPPPRDDFPSYEEDVRAARAVMPAWMGIQFRPLSEEQQRQQGLQPGAVSVRVVYPDSPAARAGLEVGDVLIGPPGRPFDEPRRVREWTMLQQVGKPRELEVLHDGRVVRRTLIPGEHPGKFPELPAPPRVGSVAPSLRLTSYQGTPPSTLDGGEPHLLFFWATWCAPCKAALPELLAFAREREVEVVAITDEEASQLDAFFGKFAREFPPLVAIDAKRDAFLSYGVSGTPTFVLVDGTGVVRSISTGYTPAKGLKIDGWSWAARPAAGS
jgi:thiol-disulfide isomerase/thioredoxin